MDIQKLKVGETFVEELYGHRLTYEVTGRDGSGYITSKLIGDVSICADTDVQTIIEVVKEAQPEPKPEPKPVAKTAPKKAPAKKPAQKKK